MFEWDETKQKANLKKHGIDFDSVWDFDWKTATINPVEKKEYGEPRWLALLPFEARVVACIFTRRGDTRRIISLRWANRKEVVRYEEETLDH